MADRMVVGRIRSPYGVQGWVWMDSFTNDRASVFEWTPWVLKRAPDRVSGRPAIERIETAPEVWKLRDKRIRREIGRFSRSYQRRVAGQLFD